LIFGSRVELSRPQVGHVKCQGDRPGESLEVHASQIRLVLFLFIFRAVICEVA
jgi:hypothetical protein